MNAADNYALREHTGPRRVDLTDQPNHAIIANSVLDDVLRRQLVTFGERIQALRRVKRLTQRQLAERVQALGLRADFTYISKIENNRVRFPPSEELIRGLAAVLETNAEELLDLAGKFDATALQEVVAEMPEAGVLLRRLQSKSISREQLQTFLDEVE
jgi:transcriptional regulator with XRE-family HTH domain